ncbi:MAG: ATP-dependent DNA helicase [Candidatus Nanopelagicales bacterium]
MTDVRPVTAVPGFGVPQLRDLLRTPFSEEQIAAITAPLSPYVVVAGAGSGKTTVMTARVVWLVATGQVRPDEVLGLTFTTKAAGELATRVRSAMRELADAVPRDPDDDLLDGEPTVATYHAFAGRLLAEHGLRIGVEPGSRLLAEAASYQLAHRVVTRTRRDLSGLGVGVQTLVEGVRSLDGELAEHCLEPADLRDHDLAFVAEVDSLDKVSAGARDARIAALQRIELSHLVDEYRAARRALDVVDFSDQMRFGARLAEECPEVGAALRDQFRVVLLDEYQDTSVAQRRLLTGLFGGGHPVTAVGDPLQAIYGWRGASVANIDDFPEHFAPSPGVRAPVLPLAENRRSGVHILESANLVAQPLRALHPQVAPLVAANAAKGPGQVRVALLETYREEVDWLADQVVGAIAEGTEPSGVAVLCRASADFPAMMRALADRGVAVEVRGVDGLLTVPEVVEVLCVLDVLHDSAANPSLVRLLTGPRWRIGARDLALLGRRARTLAGGHAWDEELDLESQLDDAVGGADPADVVSLLDALDDPGDLPYGDDALRRFAALAAEIRALRRHVGEPLADLVHRVVTTTGLDVELSAAPELLALRRAEGLHAFVDLVAAFQDAEGAASIGAFLSWLRLAERYEKVPELDRPPSPGAVQLMTVHRSKGLEWPVVVLPSLTASVFPSSKGRSRWTDARATLPYPLRGDASALPSLDGLVPASFKQFKLDCREHDEREERRLAYVALTRAEWLLVASASWWGPSQKKPRGPSAYLTALREAALDGHGEVAAWAEPPLDDATNPVLDDVLEVTWPVVPDVAAQERRREAAAAVLASLDLELADLRAEHEVLVGPLSDLDDHELDVVRGWDDDIALLLEERRAERAAVRRIALPSSLSASDLVRLAEDPDAFTKRLARPMPSRPAPAARRGTRFHAWVEAHYGVRPLLEPDDLPGAADDDVESDAALAALQETFLTSAYADRSPVGIEVPFSLVVGGRVVPGRIDAVFASADSDGTTRYEVVDWKTSQDHSADPLQLAIYRVAYAELAGVPVEQVDAAFLFVRDGAVVRPDDLPDRAGLEVLLSG